MDALSPGGAAIANVISLGFAVWYGWHVTSRTIPRIISDHQKAMAMQAADFRDSCERIDTSHREERREERREFQAALAQVVDHCRAENQRLLDLMQGAPRHHPPPPA